MTRQQTYLYRTAAYCGILLIIIVCLFLIGRPARLITQNSGEAVLDKGGVLARLRDDARLTEFQLGDIDPGSVAVKFATFGMRGVAVALLWYRVQEYQKRLDWNNVIATSNQLVFLEPSFTKIWQYCGWNLAYNASGQFDDYRERYRWVIRGVDFLITGVSKNRRAPKLLKETAWTISQRIGIADEKYQFRRMLREDDAFWKEHDALKLPSERDNWILGRRFYHQGEELIAEGESIGNDSDFNFLSHSRLNLFSYAHWKNLDGIFGPEAREAWLRAGGEWEDFKKHTYNAAIAVDGSMSMRPGVASKTARLETPELVEIRKKELAAEMETLMPGLKHEILLQRWNSLAEVPGQQGSVLLTLENTEKPFWAQFMGNLENMTFLREWLTENRPNWQAELEADLENLYTPEQLKYRRIPALLLEEEERKILSAANDSIAQVRSRSVALLNITPKVMSDEVQERDVPIETKARFRAIAAETAKFPAEVQLANMFREILNYDYRVLQTAVETTDIADTARKTRYEARNAYYDSRPLDSISGWYQSLQYWQKLLEMDGFGKVAYDKVYSRELLDDVETLAIILRNNDKIYQDHFALQDVVRQEVENENNPNGAIAALDFCEKLQNAVDMYAKQFPAAFVFCPTEQTLVPWVLYSGVLERTIRQKNEANIVKVLNQFNAINYFGDNEFMQLAPLSDVRDRIIQSQALYIRILESQSRSIPPTLPLQAYVELMMKNDPLVTTATESLREVERLAEANNAEEMEKMLPQVRSEWNAVAEKYPFIRFDLLKPAYQDWQRALAL